MIWNKSKLTLKIWNNNVDLLPLFMGFIFILITPNNITEKQI